MSALLVRVGILLLACSDAACDPGRVELTLLSAGAGAESDDEAAAGSGMSGRNASGSGESRAGAGGEMPRFPYPCDIEPDEDRELALFETLSEAMNSGRYCPRSPEEHQRPLRIEPDLQWQARSLLCVQASTSGWFYALRGREPRLGWILRDTPNLEDTKKALLGSDHQDLCNEAERIPFERIGVGNDGGDWAIFIAPALPDNMQKP